MRLRKPSTSQYCKFLLNLQSQNASLSCKARSEERLLINQVNNLQFLTQLYSFSILMLNELKELEVTSHIRKRHHIAVNFRSFSHILLMCAYKDNLFTSHMNLDNIL